MGVEGFDGQKPTILPGVAANKVQTAIKGLFLGHFLFGVQKRTVDPIVPPVLGGFAGRQGVGNFRPGHLTHPGISLLTTNDVVAVVFGQVTASSVFPVVEVIGGDVGVDSCPLQPGNDRIIVGLQGGPGVV